MKSGYFLIALVALIVSLCHGQDAGAGSDVVVLTDSNFDQQTSQGAWLVEFYAPWCGHCKKLAPIYEEVATKLKGSVNVGKVDCTVEKDLQTRFGIRGFPTIKFIKDGKLYEYSGQRTVESFLAYATESYLTASSQDVPAAKAKLTINNPNSDAAKAEVEQPKVAEASTGSDVVILTQSNFDALTSKGEWLLEFYAPWCGHCKQLAPTYEKVATALKGKVNVGKVDCTVEPSLGTRFGIRGYPTIKFLKDGTIYEYKSARTVEAFTEYAEGGYKDAASVPLPAAVPAAAAAAKETRDVKSDKPASTSGVSDVVVLTDADFDEKTAMGDWLVEFYAPWCGHCKRLAPIFEQVATALKGKVNVAKVDCTVQRGVCSQHDIRGYPTIYYFHKGQRYAFASDRTVAGFTEFVKSGWEKVTAEALPAPRSAMKEMFIGLLEDIEVLFRENLYLVIAGCIGVGLLLGLLIVLLTAPAGRPPRQPTPAATTATTTPTTEVQAEEEDEDRKKNE